MANGMMPRKTHYHSRSCNLHLCYNVAQGYYLGDPRAYIREVGEPRFRCGHCGRQARRSGNLCVPRRLPGEPKRTSTTNAEARE